jgi:phospholipase C
MKLLAAGVCQQFAADAKHVVCLMRENPSFGHGMGK